MKILERAALLLGLFCCFGKLSNSAIATTDLNSDLLWVSDKHIRPLLEYMKLDPPGMDGSVSLYPCRANHKGYIIPGKYFVHNNTTFCDLPLNGQEIQLTKDFEVLLAPVKSVEWVRTYGGNIPANALPCGTDPNTNETTYIGRVNFEGTTTLGKVVKSVGRCYVPRNYKEWSFKQYEIMTIPSHS